MNRGDFVLELVRHSVEASVLVGIVLVAQWIFRKQLGPRWACALWLLVAVRLVPVSVPAGFSLFNWLPAWRTGSVVASQRADRETREKAKPFRQEPVVQPKMLPAVAVATELTVEPAGPGDMARMALTWPEWMFRIWLAGAVLLGSYVTLGTVRLARRIGRLRPMHETETRRMLEECCVQLGMRTAPELCECAEVTTPALHGLFRPRLLLPIGFTARISTEELRFVLLHELAHVRRRDLAVGWGAAALLALHWFNPIVWLGFARWRVDREIACDAMAIEAAGASPHLAYGRTMLRLLEDFAVQSPRAGLLGIFESKRALRRRIKMIAGYQPARRSKLGAAILLGLALVGLTDAQVKAPVGIAPLPPVELLSPFIAPHLRGKSVVFLVQASESMLASTAEELARRRNDADELKRAAPKWVQTAQRLQALLEALPPGTRAQVLLFNDTVSIALPEATIEGGDAAAIAAVVRKVEATVPRGEMDLALAFATARGLPVKADRFVLLTDGFSIGSEDGPAQDRAALDKQYSLFRRAVKELPSRVPVTTILLPCVLGSPAAPALFWELANATRGALLSPASLRSPRATAEITQIAFVIDTSGSMREFNSAALWPIVVRQVAEILQAHPRLSGVKVFDSDGRPILGTADNWLPVTAGTIEEIKTALRTYHIYSESDPVPGLLRVLRAPEASNPATGRLSIYVLGDEFSGSLEAVRTKIDELNPRDAKGDRRAVINAIAFPTTIRSKFSMGNTGLKFADLMRTLTQEHDGLFIALQDL